MMKVCVLKYASEIKKKEDFFQLVDVLIISFSTFQVLLVLFTVCLQNVSNKVCLNVAHLPAKPSTVNATPQILKCPLPYLTHLLHLTE